jgi:conjugative transfer region protein TrbK
VSRIVKLVGIALLAGLMTVVTAAIATNPQPSPGPAVSAVVAPDASMRISALDRCRAVSVSDTACEAAWDAERRRFFGKPIR